MRQQLKENNISLYFPLDIQRRFGRYFFRFFSKKFLPSTYSVRFGGVLATYFEKIFFSAGGGQLGGMKKGARYGPFFMRKLSVFLPEKLQ